MKENIIKHPTKWWFAGSRHFTTKQVIIPLKVLFDKYLKKGDEVKTGGAKGIDQIVETELKHRTDIILHPSLKPNWKMGRGAGFIRNKEGVDWSDKVICIWDNKSKGTHHVIQYANKHNKIEKVVTVV